MNEPIEPKDILFVGIGTSAVCWYRCALPAMHLGADWVGSQGSPPKLHVLTGQVGLDTKLPNFNDYKVVILQQPRGKKWMHTISNLQAKGIKVLYEVDDYLHGVRKQKGHDFAAGYSKAALRDIELCMRACDGILASTPWLGRRYRKFHKKVYVVENGLDMARYKLTRPERPSVNIGWAGATGHKSALVEWLNVCIDVMKERDDAHFVAVGQHDAASPFQQIFGEHRAIGIPFVLIEQYPSAMTMFDIALAPAGKTDWYKGKSDLRWLEAAALGVPIIADPTCYPHIEHGVTGFHANSSDELRSLLFTLIDDPELRDQVGSAAKEYVREHRDMKVASLHWLEVCRAVAGEYESAALVPRQGS